MEPGITLVGALPEEPQKKSVVSAAVSSKATDMNAAKQFLPYLTSDASAESMKKSGWSVKMI